MRYRLLSFPLFALLAFGCNRPSVAPVPQIGDVIHPEISFAPEGPWAAGETVSIGVLLRVERTGETRFYLTDKQVTDKRTVTGRLVYLSGGNPMGDPLELPFVKDC
ncbi:MAG: hypothetical protein MUF18_12960 [Fimbriiglobus sp.]|jgi:hypothetical protein|nr:hypothetical protein [Fimbriiglobus sp.]